MNEKWIVEFKPSAFKELKKLDKKVQEKVFNFLDKLIKDYSSPRSIGLQLQGNHKNLWRYPMGDYRLILNRQIKLTYFLGCFGAMLLAKTGRGASLQGA